MSAAEMIPHEGDEALRDDVLRAIGTVVDPEMGLSVVDVGLVITMRLSCPARLTRLGLLALAAASLVLGVAGSALAVWRPIGGAVLYGLALIALAAFAVVMAYAVYRGAREARRAHPEPVVQN